MCEARRHLYSSFSPRIPVGLRLWAGRLFRNELICGVVPRMTSSLAIIRYCVALPSFSESSLLPFAVSVALGGESFRSAQADNSNNNIPLL